MEKTWGRVGIVSLKFCPVVGKCKSMFRMEVEGSGQYRMTAHLSFNQRNMEFISFLFEVSEKNFI